MSTNELKLDILGTSFSITADADEEYLTKVLNQYKTAVSNTQKISGISEPLNIAILTGFMLCDEINKMKQLQEKIENNAMSVLEEQDEEAQEVEERTIRLINKLEQALSLFGNDKNN
jgi:cell division protein ZapA (FtsZ GTPase activity inhibitor)